MYLMGRIGLAILLTAFAVERVWAEELDARRGNIDAGGAFTCDFGLPPGLDFGAIPGGLERDRMYQSSRPGFVRKLVPLRIDLVTGELFSGGRYLFDRREDADAYTAWLEQEFVLDGTLFFDRPVFLAPECRAWSVIGAQDLAPLPSHVVVRTEWWSVPESNQRKLLADRFPALVEVARARGLAGVWELYSKQDRLVAFVYFGGRVAPPDPSMPDFASLAAIELPSPLGELFDDQPWLKVFDRSHWALATWLPFAAGDTGEPSLWPNSPPFPLPYAGDGVCEVSRGENSTNAPTDCVATCGDGIAQPGESNVSCPGDVPYF